MRMSGTWSVSPATIADAFLLREPERRAAGYPAAASARIRELATAAGERARAADLLVEQSVPAALTLYREAALLYVAAFLGASAGEVAAETLDPRKLLPRFRAAAPASREGRLPERFLALVVGDDPIAADRLGRHEAIELAEGARASVRWLAGLVEPRTVAEIKGRRWARVGAAALAATLLVAWIASALLSRENVALHKPVTVSGVHPQATSPPSGLTDGVSSGSYGVHTSFAEAAWAQVDLEAVYALSGVKIYNRGDGWFDEGLPMTLQLSENGRDFVDVATRTTPFGQVLPWSVDAAGRRARYVRVRGARGRYVSLSELEAFGEKL